MTVRILTGDCRDVLRTLPSESVHCVVTSPPYWGLRDYGNAAQIGLEADFTAYVTQLVGVFRECRRALRSNGTLWLNLGDSYNSIGHKKSNSGNGTTGLAGGKAQDHHPLHRENTLAGLKHKDLCGVPWRVAFALQADGWWLRQDIIWSKPNPMPESVTDRCTKAHEYLFLLSKSERYYYDADAIKEEAKPESASRYNYDFNGTRGAVICPGDPEGQRTRPDGKRESDGKRNKRSVWEVTTQPFADAHFATFPSALIEPCIKAGCPTGGGSPRPFRWRRNDRPCRGSSPARRHPDRTQSRIRSDGRAAHPQRSWHVRRREKRRSAHAPQTRGIGTLA